MDIAFESSASYLATPREGPNPESVFKHSMPLYNTLRLLKLINMVPEFALPHVSGMEFEALALQSAKQASRSCGRPWQNSDDPVLFGRTVWYALRSINERALHADADSKLRSTNWLGIARQVLDIVTGW